ncbi:uncharacterized protein LOC134214649 [Armigeres subalbatus]|uniref:uncharacterized protein LOC134214649 n=1 Tax=Armigeres subalbatus TaxID=124917 RepID=UPI002ECFDCFE
MDPKFNILLIFSTIMVTFYGVQSEDHIGNVCTHPEFTCFNVTHFQYCHKFENNTSITVTEPILCSVGSYCISEGDFECSGLGDPPLVASVNDPTVVPAYKCTEEGIFADKDDCLSYFTCVKESDGFKVTRNGCLYGTAFDPVLQRCTNDQTPCYKNFKCTKDGKFADPSDPTHYYLCTWNGLDYQIYHVKCEDGKKFDEVSGECK